MSNVQTLTPPQKKFVLWMQRVHPAIYREVMKPGQVQTMGTVGDFWSDLRDKFMSKATDAVQQVATKAADKAPDIIKAYGEAALIKKNIQRVDEGKDPLSTVDVAGFGKERNYIIMGVLAVAGIIAAPHIIKALKGRR